MTEPLERGVSPVGLSVDTYSMTTSATSKLRAPHEPRSHEPQVGTAGFGTCDTCWHTAWLAPIREVRNGLAYGTCSNCKEDHAA